MVINRRYKNLHVQKCLVFSSSHTYFHLIVILKFLSVLGGPMGSWLPSISQPAPVFLGTEGCTSVSKPVLRSPPCPTPRTVIFVFFCTVNKQCILWETLNQTASYPALLQKKKKKKEYQTQIQLRDQNTQIKSAVLRHMNCPSHSVMTLEKHKGLMYPF